MSAFYARAYADCVELLTDGAMYVPDGTLVDIREKIWRSASLPIAVTGRGSAAFAALAETILDTPADTVDALVASTQARLERLKAVYLAEACELLLVGISESRGPRLWFVTTTSIYPEYEPFVLHDVGSEFGGGNALAPEEVANLPSAENGLAELAMPLFEAMRRKPGLNPTVPHLPGVYGIGGHLDHTVVTASETSTTRLHTWADVVGHKIDPFADVGIITHDDGSTFDDGSGYDQ
ncbi:hypothetical protein [Mesorhizobium sp. GbtcB19]|uniref:hypothetical protein n=1 Tax=Mesorhizobium sp. GbtcB19 TaxID=2824764 RepID=UPI001C2F3D4F|nr:hypothetical protein [Mesorhizobium sp. GbtcB19]